MLINGRDITYHGNVRQWRVDIGNRAVKNESEWVRGSPLPFFDANAAGFKDVIVTLMVYGESREDIKHAISNILSDLLVPAELMLDGWEHMFCGILQKSNTKEHTDQSRKRFQTLELQFTGYEYSEPAIKKSNAESTLTITNPGNVVSPAVLEITPIMGAADVVINGICRDSQTGEDLPVTIKKLTAGNKIVLDGITGKITENGKLKEVDIWALPTLLPGKNTIKFDTVTINASVKVRALYM